MHFLVPLLALVLYSCETEEPVGNTPSAAQQLAELGKKAAGAHPEIRIEGSMGKASFSADYAPKKKTLIYELNNGAQSERFVVSPDEAIYSTTGKPDRKINRDSVMPNGKDWPYASRMAAPFLDAIDGYAATLHSFVIEATDPPAEVSDADSLSWFSLMPNKNTIHDLLLLEFSKVRELKIGVDPQTGLLKSLFSCPSKPDHPTAEIRSK